MNAYIDNVASLIVYVLEPGKLCGLSVSYDPIFRRVEGNDRQQLRLRLTSSPSSYCRKTRTIWR